MKFFAIEDVFESVTGLFTLLAEEKRVELIVELPVHHDHYFLGDQLRITQILNNIVGNALKFTEQGYVKLSLTITDIAGDQLQNNWRLVLKIRVLVCRLSRLNNYLFHLIKRILPLAVLLEVPD